MDGKTNDTTRPLVSLVRLEDYEPARVERAIEEVLEPLGGLKAFVAPGGEVLLKPNFLKPATAEAAVNTHPEVMRAAARLALRCGAGRVVIADSPAVATAARCARKLGLSADEPFAIEEIDEALDRSVPGGRFQHLQVSRRLLEATCLVNLAKAKTHGQMILTGAVKNLFGAVLGLEKAQWHLRAGRDEPDFARLLVEIYELVRPRLNLLDAVIGMEGNGPGAGDPRRLGFLAASTSGHALDAVLCRILDLPPEKIFTVAIATRLGLVPPVEQIAVVGADPLSLRPDPPIRLARPVNTQRLGLPAWTGGMFERLFALRPEVDAKKCTLCGQCVEVCAARALEIDPEARKLKLDRDRCISCFCCQELCPEGAMSVSAGPMARLLGVGRSPSGKE